MTLTPILSAPASCCRPRSVLRDRHAIDLDVEGPGPLRHTEEDPGWGVFREVALIDFVEGLEPVRRDAQHIALQHWSRSAPAASSAFFNCSRISSTWRSNGAWTRISPVSGSKGGMPETNTMLPARVQVDTGAPHFSKLLSIGSNRMISRFMRPFLVHVSPI